MARKSLGFVPLVWECPSCETQNPGQIKSCTSCGAPQPPDIEFQLVDEDKFNFIKDEALLREIKAGPDIHCPYCGTRNLATNKVCTKCGGDLSLGGKVRESGQRVQTVSEAQEAEKLPPKPTPVEQPPAKRRRNVLIFGIVGALVLVLCFVLVYFLFLKTDDVTAAVTGVQWKRTIDVEAYTSVTREAWWDEISSNDEILSCTQEKRYTSDTPVANATEVCGEVYYEDTGSGAAEAVQDCTYEVYDDYCKYSTMDWVVVDTAIASGEDTNPSWPLLNLPGDQREGLRQENYVITFSDGGETYQYTTTDSALFIQAEPGSRWTISVNQLGRVQSIQSAN